MFSLPAKRDRFRLILPKELIPDEIQEKYTKILNSAHSFFYKPIDFLNESVQKIEVCGFTNATVAQMQPQYGRPIRDPSRTGQNRFLHAGTDYQYRSAMNTEALVDKTLNVDFRHTIGFVNYFMLFESFLYQYSRDTRYIPDMDYVFNIEILDHLGSVYAKIVLQNPVIDSLDMLSLDFTQPQAASSTFRCVWKYSNFDYQFIEYDAASEADQTIPFKTEIEDARASRDSRSGRFLRYPYPETETGNVEDSSKAGGAA